MGSQLEAAPRRRLRAIPMTELEVGMRVWARGVVVDRAIRSSPPEGHRRHRAANGLGSVVVYVTFHTGEILAYSMRERILLEFDAA